MFILQSYFLNLKKSIIFSTYTKRPADSCNSSLFSSQTCGKNIFCATDAAGLYQIESRRFKMVLIYSLKKECFGVALQSFYTGLQLYFGRFSCIMKML